MSKCIVCGGKMADPEARVYKNCYKCGRGGFMMHVPRPPGEEYGRPQNPYYPCYAGMAFDIETIGQ